MSKKFELILSEDELLNLVKILPKDGVIVLKGNLASGKTTLVKQIVKFHGISEVATSPTFSVMQNYGEIYHYDIYNSGFEGILKNGLYENFFEDGLHLVEWGDENLMKLLEKFGLDYCVVEIENLDKKRKYKVSYA
ncbi:tRNA (adenosine(37)-N6)-threonylcarbamoyltransferase complex ATPase subunit type 1 TsaE [Campylobacter geochelonis]|uniref:tRNA (adenosine(37)-N6)-threonylcarbamoyltransferase complex ATPase subunit type 1 TsaE n=1 Tax=Campylobacter geochelonis TaxID=1780362 RepID=UPI0007707D4A|nr:tRNA (adenosine(37)-N6)-threonylcarbamoyltransferase complex ATPase subunit type 1 TsaE [Campylobacter geochelonis]CZE49459.1 ATP/GTP binding protein [Campylobacter geochelonis]CZE51502.1 ATP/GTP binding protein [Campylobacter geochelonis]